MFFFGEFPYTVDDRNRVPIPPPFRGEFERGGLVMMPGAEPCVVLYTRESFEEAMAGIRQLPDELKYVRDAQRQIFARARWVEKLDTQARVSLEPRMLTAVGIDKNVVVVGADSRLEIWDRETWERRSEEREHGYARALEEVGGWRTAQLGVGGTR